jgi:hypothetical protein
MYTQSRHVRPIRGHLGQYIAQTPSLGEFCLRPIEAFVNDAPRRESVCPSQVISNHPRRIALPTQAWITAAVVNTFPVATLWHRRCQTTRTAKQQAHMGPQCPPGIPTPRVPDSVVPSQQNPGIQRQLHPCHHLAPQRPQPGHRWGCITGQPMKVYDTVSSWATQQLAEQQTMSCSSCMLPTVHQGGTTARHRSDPCSSRHPKCQVNLSNLGSVNDS